MTATKRVAVYIRGDRAYVAPQSAGDGVRVDLAPVFTTSLGPAELAEALRRALGAAPTEPPAEMPDLRAYRSPVLEAAGVRSASALEKGLRYCTVSSRGGRLEVQRYRRRASGRGLERDGAAVTCSSFDGVAILLLRCP